MTVRTFRIIFAFLLAPLVPGFLLGLLDQSARSPVGIAWYVQLAAIVGYPVAIGLGIPLYAHLSEGHKQSGPVVVAIGACLGALAMLVVVLVSSPFGLVALNFSTFLSLAPLLPIAALWGAISGFIFWMIATLPGR